MGLRQTRFANPFAEPPPHSEDMLDEDIGVQAWAARIDAPSAVGRDAAGPDALPRRAGLIAIAESGIAAAEVGVALPQGGVRQSFRDRDRIGDEQSVPQGLRLAKDAHGFRVAEMRVDVHEPDLSAEEGRQLRPSKHGLRAPMIGERPVHQPRAVRKQQMLADEGEMAIGLRRREEPADDRLGHRDQGEREPCPIVARMKEQLRRAALRLERAVAGDDAVADQKAIEVLSHGGGERVVLSGRLGAPDAPQDFGVATKLLIKQRDRPTARHRVA